MNSDHMEQAIADNYYKELNIPNQRQVNAFKLYQKIVHYAFHMHEPQNILEIEIITQGLSSWERFRRPV